MDKKIKKFKRSKGMGESNNGFKKQKRAFEAKHHFNEELHFHIKGCRNYLFGLWMVSLLGYTEGVRLINSKDLKGVEIKLSDQRL